MEAKIKVSAPAQNPHICYIHREYKSKIEAIKEKTSLSLYNLLCLCSNQSLKTSEQIKDFKKDLKKRGFRHIGEWAEVLIEFLYDNVDNLNSINLENIKIERKEK